MSIWVGSLHDIRYDQAAIDAIKQKSDTKYWNNQEGINKGITAVPRERWEEAQRFEKHGWMEAWAHDHDDRSTEHQQLFNNYHNVKPHLGDILEVGCGPFTQTKTIIQGRTAKTITLQDPLINSYLNHRNCTYRNNLLNHPTTYIPTMLEESQLGQYDTIICINVLEHVMNAHICLNKILNALRPTGTIIFGERHYDNFDPHQEFCIGHPIRICKQLIDEYKKNFHITYERTDNSYFIGQKY